MATLKSLLQDRLGFISDDESNLEQGRIWVYAPSNNYTNFHTGICWVAPADGTAVIEIWGAGGSGAKMCCCGGGLPGNPGAYSRKTIDILAGCTVTGIVGFSCGNSDAICFRGCSEATCVTFQCAGTTGCMCAQGGRGGTSYCSTGTALYCCFGAGQFCTTKTANENCGIVCNYGPGAPNCCADAFGGDINLRGGYSRASFFGCRPTCPCCFYYHYATPPGYHSCDGGEVTVTNDADSGYALHSGSAGQFQFVGVLGLMGRQSREGMWGESICYNNTRSCGCYNFQGCNVYSPAGHPGGPPHPCPDVRDHAWRGGHGALRIKFIKDE